jgi:hypothetical protein
MIWESAYWKEELLRHARRIRRRQALTSRSTAGLEKDLMIGFYSIRKLVEAHKVSEEIRDRPLHLQGYPWAGSPVTFMNWDRIDQKYDLEHPVGLTRTVMWLANQMIHSFAFMPCFDSRGKLDSILFNSDRTRRQHLYVMRVNEIIILFEEVSANDPASLQCTFNRQTGDYDVWIGPTMQLPGPATNNSMQRTALRAPADAER